MCTLILPRNAKRSNTNSLFEYCYFRIDPHQVVAWAAYVLVLLVDRAGGHRNHQGHGRPRCASEGPPPGSKSGAGLHKGSSGTWESHLSPCHTPGLGDRVPKGPGVVWGLRPAHEPGRESTSAQKQG